MGGRIPVAGLYQYCEQMLRDAWGYIWGTSGELWTASKQSTTTNDMAQKYGAKWIGHRVADCSGVMVYIWRQYGQKIAHGSNSIRRQSVGQTQLVPAPGYAAFRVRGEDYYHIGIVAEDGKTVYEAKGTQAGFVTSEAESWDCFAPFKDVDYSAQEEPMDGGVQVSYRAEVTTKSGPLNIRTGPGTEYPVKAKVRKGEVVDVWMEYPSGWRFIDDDGQTGYVDGSYLTKIGPSDAPDDGDGGVPRPAETTRLRRSDGTEIVLEGDWQVVYSTVGDD